MALPNQVYHKRKLEQQLGFAQAVRAGSTLYVTGSVSWDEDGNIMDPGDMGKQIQNVYQDISETLKAHDASLRNIVKETVYTTDLDALAKNADVRARFFQGEDIAPPASSWVQVSRLGDPEWLIEVEVTAVLDQEY